MPKQIDAGMRLELTHLLEEWLACDAGDFKPEDDLREDYGVDFMEFETLSLDFDERFGIELEEGWYTSIHTMRQLVEYLEQHLAA